MVSPNVKKATANAQGFTMEISIDGIEKTLEVIDDESSMVGIPDHTTEQRLTEEKDWEMLKNKVWEDLRFKKRDVILPPCTFKILQFTQVRCPPWYVAKDVGWKGPTFMRFLQIQITEQLLWSKLGGSGPAAAAGAVGGGENVKKRKGDWDLFADLGNLKM